MEDKEPQDAFGTPIVLGSLYGYATNQNGYTTSFKGIAQKITPSGKITMSVEKRYRALWNDNVELDGEPPYRSVSVKPNMLIPTHV